MHSTPQNNIKSTHISNGAFAPYAAARMLHLYPELVVLVEIVEDVAGSRRQFLLELFHPTGARLGIAIGAVGA